MIISNDELKCMHFLISDSYSSKIFARIDTPRRIIHDHIFDKLIVGTTRYRDSLLYSELKLLCSISGNVLCSFSLSENEQIVSLNSTIKFTLILGWEARGKNNYITIGTSGYYDEQFDDKYGRVIVLGIKSKQVIERFNH
jgi:hypothetical protein